MTPCVVHVPDRREDKNGQVCCQTFMGLTLLAFPKNSFLGTPPARGGEVSNRRRLMQSNVLRWRGVGEPTVLSLSTLACFACIQAKKPRRAYHFADAKCSKLHFTNKVLSQTMIERKILGGVLA
jgi:hypothetical protein